MKSIVRSAFLVACLLQFGSGFAADNCSGRVSNVSIGGDTFDAGNGLSVAWFHAYSVVTSENSINNTAGKCGGYSVTTADGKTRLVGVCARKNKEGDGWSDEWVFEAGAERGTWKMAGGSGAFAGKSWSGWWKPVSDDGKIFMGVWGGTCN